MEDRCSVSRDSLRSRSPDDAPQVRPRGFRSFGAAVACAAAAPNGDLKQRFEREAKTICNLNHGWVILAQDDDEEDDLDDAEDDGGEDEDEEEDDDYPPEWSPGWSD